MENKDKKVRYGEEMMHLFMALGKKMRELGRMQAACYGINSSELEIISFLAHSPHDTSKDLVCNKGYSRSLVSKTVDSLLKNKYIAAEQDLEDRRIMHLKLLPKAQEIVTEMHAMRAAMKDKLLAGVTEEEIGNMISIFHKIQGNAEQLLTEEPRENE